MNFQERAGCSYESSGRPKNKMRAQFEADKMIFSIKKILDDLRQGDLTSSGWSYPDAIRARRAWCRISRNIQEDNRRKHVK